MFEPIYFKRSEFTCPCCGREEMDDDFLRSMDYLRKIFRSPIKILSGFRCERRNADPSVGGVPGSQHLNGLAADITPIGLMTLTLFSAMVEPFVWMPGIIGQPSMFSTVRIYPFRRFIHVDSRQVVEGRYNPRLFLVLEDGNAVEIHLVGGN